PSLATLLVVTMIQKGGAFWVNAAAVGDSCLLLLSSKGPILSFPISKVSDFERNPDLINSKSETVPCIKRWEGELQSGDLLLCCTDAVAKWALACHEAHQENRILQALLPAFLEPDSSAFKDFIAESRVGCDGISLRNDDSTVAVLTTIPFRQQRAIPRPDDSQARREKEEPKGSWRIIILLALLLFESLFLVFTHKDVEPRREPTLLSLYSGQYFSCLVPQGWSTTLPVWNGVNGPCLRLLHTNNSPGQPAPEIIVERYAVGSGPYASATEYLRAIHA